MLCFYKENFKSPSALQHYKIMLRNNMRPANANVFVLKRSSIACKDSIKSYLPEELSAQRQLRRLMLGFCRRTSICGILTRNPEAHASKSVLKNFF